MRFARFLLPALVLVTASPVWAVDYSKIDRVIRKEPKYQSKRPRYALLLFGPKAEFKVWMVLDGETVYIDRNGDGDLTGPDERFDKLTGCKNIKLSHPDGKTTYVLTSMSKFTHVDKKTKIATTYVVPNIDIKGPRVYQQYASAAVSRDRAKASLSHFDGPLTASPKLIKGKLPQDVKLHAGKKPTELYAIIGTLNEKYGCWVVVRTDNGENCAFPQGVRPTVVVEFPPKKPGGPIVTKRFTLSGFC